MKRAFAVLLLSLAPAALWAGEGRVLACTKNVVIENAVTRTRLPIAAAALKSDQTDLILRDIHFDVHPGTQFHVVLERRDAPEKRVRVGTLSFYTQDNSATLTRSFDITDELREIATSKANLQNVVLVFEATSGQSGAKRPVFNSRLTVGEIKVRSLTGL